MTTTDTTETNGRARESERGRDVVLPVRLYKTVTVFSTLLAMVGVVGGFALLDVATNRAQAPLADVNLLLALLGLGVMGAGAGVYAYASRFRTPGMGKDKDGSRGGSDHG